MFIRVRGSQGEVRVKEIVRVRIVVVVVDIVSASSWIYFKTILNLEIM